MIRVVLTQPGSDNTLAIHLDPCNTFPAPELITSGGLGGTHPLLDWEALASSYPAYI